MNNGRRVGTLRLGCENRPEGETLHGGGFGLPGETSRARRQLECENQADGQAAAKR
jgi:hypothetical protein